jgi:hypothetical protein
MALATAAPTMNHCKTNTNETKDRKFVFIWNSFLLRNVQAGARNPFAGYKKPDMDFFVLTV